MTIKTRSLGPVSITGTRLRVPGWSVRKMSAGLTRDVWHAKFKGTGEQGKYTDFVLKFGGACRQEARLWDEAKDTASAKWLVPVLEHGTQDNEHWLIMPFVDLETKAVSVLKKHAMGVSIIAYEMDVRDIAFSDRGSVNWGVNRATGRALIYDYAQ